MSDREFLIHAVWDEDARVFYAESDVPGLNVEAATLQAFVEVLKDVLPDLIGTNADQHLDEGGRTRVRLETELVLA